MSRRNEVVICIRTETSIEYQRAIFISATALKRRGRPRSEAEKARARERNAEWREANLERSREYHSQYYEENKEQILEQRATYYKANAEDIKNGQRMKYRRQRKDPKWRRYRADISRNYRKRERVKKDAREDEEDKRIQQAYTEMRRHWKKQDGPSGPELTAPTRRGILTIAVVEKEDLHDTW